MYTRSTIKTAARDITAWSTSSNALYSSIPRNSSDADYFINDLPGITVDLLNYVDDEKNVSDYINQVHDDSIVKIVDAFVQKQKVNLNSKELLQHNTLIQQLDDLDHPIVKDGRFVGYAIVPRESNTIITNIREAGFMSSAADSFTLYLYDTSQKSAIQSKTVSTDSADTIKWTSLDWDISFDSETGSAGQTYLIGYFEDDVTADLYDIDWNGNHAHTAQKIFGRYVGCRPIRITSAHLDGTNIPNRDALEGGISCRTSGFNLRFNSKCDITNILTDNISMFAEALQYQIAIKILQDALSYTTLNNVTNAQQLRANWTELIEDYKGILKGGITAAGIPVKGLLDNLSMDFSNIDAICLKSKKGQIKGVKW